VEAPEVGPLPASTAETITFVCMNHAIKISRTALALWVRILAAVPRSRLLLLATADPGQRASVLAFMAGAGVAAERIEQVGEAPIATYLARYLRADIALDSLPCAGGTTTCDALWMGVPVVTLVGGRSPAPRGAARGAARSAARLTAARRGRLRSGGRGSVRCDVGTRRPGAARMNADVEVDLVPQQPPLLELRHVSKRFVRPLDLPARIANLLGAGLSDEVVHAVDRVDLGIAEREVVGLVGESGCGK